MRRRRAAKLSHFFGVNHQDISQSITQKLLPPAPQQTYSDFGGDINNPVVEVDVKVVGRRFWGLSDGGIKNADVADVIGKLRGLRVLNPVLPPIQHLFSH
ncbi:hypothetical protein C0993_007027 [Termitomyces sp. T159_Od127]|nr:hypothetical protein C0993_007027 [Termitomyces sp. T159_Od127]